MKKGEVAVIDTEKQGFHEDVIICPECGELQNAKVLHVNGADVKLHTCVTCGFNVTESDWLSKIIV